MRKKYNTVDNHLYFMNHNKLKFEKFEIYGALPAL